MKFNNDSASSDSTRTILSAAELIYKTARYGNQIGNLTGVYDVSKVGKIELLNHGHEDYILWLMILKQGYIAKNTNSIEAKYRVSSNSISSDKYKASKWTWYIYRRILNMNIVTAGYCYIRYAIRGLTNYFK